MLRIPKTSLIVLCGSAGCGKSTFAQKNFKAYEIVSSDKCRAMISDDEENMSVSREAFELFHLIIKRRMERRRLVTADSTALSYDARKKLLQLAREHGYYTVLVLFDIPLEEALNRNSMRNRVVSEKVIEKQYSAFKRTLKTVEKEGFDDIVRLTEDNMNDFSFSVIEDDEAAKNAKPLQKKSSIHAANFYLDDEGHIEIKEGLDFYKHPGNLILPGRNKTLISIEGQEISDAIIHLESCSAKLPWVVYYPPIVPCIKSEDIRQQLFDTVKYYKEKGIQKLIINQRNMEESYIFIICKDKSSSLRYFRDDRVWQVYSPYNSASLDDIYNSYLLEGIYKDLSSSRYFDDSSTEFVIFEGYISRDEEYIVIPYKMISYSSMPLLYEDNSWQIESINKLCGHSPSLKNPEVYIINNEDDVKLYLAKLEDKKHVEFAVIPCKSYLYYKKSLIQPEILCSDSKIYSGEGVFKLSTDAYSLSLSGLDRYIKYKSPEKYLEYIIGCAAVNNKIMKLSNMV